MSGVLRKVRRVGFEPRPEFIKEAIRKRLEEMKALAK